MLPAQKNQRRLKNSLVSDRYFIHSCTTATVSNVHAWVRPLGAFGNHFLATLTEKTIKTLLPFLELVRLSSNGRLYETDDDVDFVYFPETAVISEYRTLEGGKTLEIGMIGKEGAAGLLFLFSSARSPHGAQVLVPGNAYRISRELLKNLMSSDGRLQNIVLHFINIYIGQISRRAVCSNFHSLEQRLCCWLLMIQNSQEAQRLRVTQVQISACLGALRTSLGPIARELKKKKIIDYARGKIIILDEEELKRVACGCHSEITERFY